MANGFEYKVEKGKEFRIDVEVTVSPTRFQEYQDNAYERLAREVKLPGFRNGKAPRAQVLAKIGSKLITEAVKDMIPVVASEIIDADKLSPITTLDYDVKEVKVDGSVVFTFNFINYPDIKLGDLSKLKIDKVKPQVTDTDVQEVMQRLFKQPHVHDHEHDHEHEHEDGDEDAHAEHDHAEPAAPVTVTDGMAKDLGIEGITTVKELESKVRDQLMTMKQNEAEQQMDGALLTEAIKASEIPLPEQLISQQTAYLVDDYVSRIEQLGVDIAGFLKAQGTDMEKIREQKREQAKEKLSQELIMNEIVKKYELTPKAEEIESEISSITDAETRQSYDNYQGRRYVLSVLVQRNAVMKLRELAGIKS